MVGHTNDINRPDISNSGQHFSHFTATRNNTLHRCQLPPCTISAAVNDGINLREVEQERRFHSAVPGHVRHHNSHTYSHTFKQPCRLCHICVGHPSPVLGQHRGISAQSPLDQVGCHLTIAVPVFIVGTRYGGDSTNEVYLSCTVAAVEFADDGMVLVEVCLRTANRRIV